VKLKLAKPKPADEKPAVEHVTIKEEKAKLAQVKQGPEIVQEKFVPHADQIQLKQKFQPKAVKPGEQGTIESDALKGTPPVVKQ